MSLNRVPYIFLLQTQSEKLNKSNEFTSKIDCSTLSTARKVSIWEEAGDKLSEISVLNMHFFYKQKLLQSAQLKRLADHKYSCQNISILGMLEGALN